MSLPITIFDLECNTDVPDANGVQWSCLMDGWAGFDLRTGSMEPTGRDGLALLQAFRGGKPMRFTGNAFASSEADAWAGYYAFAGMFGINDDGDIIADEPGVPKKVSARVSAAPLISTPLGTHQSWTMKWDLAFMAPFPLKTAATANATVSLSSGVSWPLLNAGTAAAYPVVTATSSGTVDLVIGGRHFITDTLASGTVIDMWERTIRDGSGNDVSPWPKNPASEWLAVPAGGVSAQQLGTAGLSVVTYDTYA